MNIPETETELRELDFNIGYQLGYEIEKIRNGEYRCVTPNGLYSTHSSSGGARNAIPHFTTKADLIAQVVQDEESAEGLMFYPVIGPNDESWWEAMWVKEGVNEDETSETFDVAAPTLALCLSLYYATIHGITNVY